MIHLLFHLLGDDEFVPLKGVADEIVEDVDLLDADALEEEGGVDDVLLVGYLLICWQILLKAECEVVDDALFLH